MIRFNIYGLIPILIAVFGFLLLYLLLLRSTIQKKIKQFEQFTNELDEKEAHAFGIKKGLLEQITQSITEKAYPSKVDEQLSGMMHNGAPANEVDPFFDFLEKQAEDKALKEKIKEVKPFLRNFLLLKWELDKTRMEYQKLVEQGISGFFARLLRYSVHPEDHIK